MPRLGEQWHQQVPRNKDNYRVLAEGIERREAAAEAWTAQVRHRDLAEGIDSCIGRGSDSLALPMPTELVATATLHDFLTTLRSQALLVDVALDADEPGTSLLLLTPSGS